jgi:putative membrane protein
MTSDSVDPGRYRQIGLWLAIGGILLAGIGFGWNPTPVAQGLAAVFIACALLHAVVSYGLLTGLMLYVAFVAITFTIENIGVATGFPFGHYHFEVAANLPHVGLIPIVVGPLWFGGTRGHADAFRTAAVAVQHPRA